MNNRPERPTIFLVVWLTMFSCISVAGQDFYKWGIKKDYTGFSSSGMLVTYAVCKSEGRPFIMSGGGYFPDQIENTSQAPIKNKVISIPPDIYYLRSGYMCKREWQLEKATHIPFRFRLGSLADCNALEGKHSP